MNGKEDYRIFVGGLSWDVTERRLEDAFSRFGKIIDSQIMLERDSGRPRGFGFITFADRRAMEDSIRDMHGRDLGDRTISVNKAQPKFGCDDFGHGYDGGYLSGGRAGVGYGGGVDRSVGQDVCFKCGRLGHWARECSSNGGGRVGGGFQSSSHLRFGGDGDGSGGRADRYGGERDRYIDRYNGGRYGERVRFDARDPKYAPRDVFVNDRYAPPADRFSGDRYGGGTDRCPHGGGRYGRERGFEREVAPRGSNVRYGSGGATRTLGRSYHSRGDPYDRPVARPRPTSFERY